jgi:cytochrome P450 family 4
MRPTIIFNLTSDKKRYDRCLQIVHTFTRQIIEKRRETIITEVDENHQDDFYGIKKKMALLDVLLKSTIDGKPLTNADIAEEVDTFMFEGHDTVTAAATFTLYLLSQYPEAQQNVYEEVTRIVGHDLNVYPTYNQLLEMKYVECCIKESLRMFPPVPIIGRTLDEDLIVDGNILPAGVNFNMMIYHLNRNAKYFNHPDAFMPERFYEGNFRFENPFLFVPFSAGPR